MEVAVRDRQSPPARPAGRTPVGADPERALIQAIDRAANVLALLDQDTRRLTAPLVEIGRAHV